MFTNNFINYQKRLFGELDSFSVVDCTGASVTSYNYGPDQYSGIGRYMKCGRCSSLMASIKTTTPMNQSACGVFFGTGSTPATKEDYTLESLIASGLSITSPGSIIPEKNGAGRYSYSASFGVENTTDTEINIYEIGLFCPIYASSSYWGGSSQPWSVALMERTVLSEPITIAPGESKLVTYKITFNQTLNVD